MDRGPVSYFHDRVSEINVSQGLRLPLAGGKLLPLNFRIIFSTRTSESFEAARDERLNVSGNPSQYDDLRPFIEQQEMMRELVARSILPSLKLDVSDNNINAAVERVADWMEQTGGPYMS